MRRVIYNGKIYRFRTSAQEQAFWRSVGQNETLGGEILWA